MILKTSKKQLVERAKDGHMFNDLPGASIIDNWFTDHKIQHTTNVSLVSPVTVVTGFAYQCHWNAEGIWIDYCSRLEPHLRDSEHLNVFTKGDLAHKFNQHYISIDGVDHPSFKKFFSRGKNKGVSITFEGINGSGKSTLRNEVSKLLADRSKDIINCKEMYFGGMNSSGLLTYGIDVSSTEAFTFAELAHEISFFEQVKRWKDRGKIVLVDRGVLTTLVYNQCGLSLNSQFKKFFKSFADLQLSTPACSTDVTFLIDTPVNTCLKRIKSRNSEKQYIPKKRELEDMRTLFYDYAKRSSTYILHNYKQDSNSVNQLAHEVVEVLKELKLI